MKDTQEFLFNGKESKGSDFLIFLLESHQGETDLAANVSVGSCVI